ncbi:hypothetical protein K438DRAFT_1970216 [Mycena galopus ATCC 62051]|nr:hypothetical protein K438DRAFT_1970216 [Mycena galopus ATCC 62051]
MLWTPTLPTSKPCPSFERAAAHFESVVRTPNARPLPMHPRPHLPCSLARAPRTFGPRSQRAPTRRSLPPRPASNAHAAYYFECARPSVLHMNASWASYNSISAFSASGTNNNSNPLFVLPPSRSRFHTGAFFFFVWIFFALGVFGGELRSAGLAFVSYSFPPDILLYSFPSSFIRLSPPRPAVLSLHVTQPPRLWIVLHTFYPNALAITVLRARGRCASAPVLWSSARAAGEARWRGDAVLVVFGQLPPHTNLRAALLTNVDDRARRPTRASCPCSSTRL